jgi:hypothetical protein
MSMRAVAVAGLAVALSHSLNVHCDFIGIILVAGYSLNPPIDIRISIRVCFSVVGFHVRLAIDSNTHADVPLRRISKQFDRCNRAYIG